MRILIQCTKETMEVIKTELLAKFSGEYTIEKENQTDYSLTAAVDPHLFRGISEIFTASKKSKEMYKGCHLEIIEQSIKKDSASDINQFEEVKEPEIHVEQIE